MDHSGGETASISKRAKLAVIGGSIEDRLSALPDDVLIRILVKLRDTLVAARTSILSRRWRRIWALLPEIHFYNGVTAHRLLGALGAHEAPALLHVVAVTLDASAYSMSSCLQIVAPRLSGELIVRNMRQGVYRGNGAFELPCFRKATSIRLDLGHLTISMPILGVFVRLTDLSLDQVELHGPCQLTDIVSSARCPSLRKLEIRYSRGLSSFTVQSDSLRQMKLCFLHSLSKLTIVAPQLLGLIVNCGFLHGVSHDYLIANISAPKLVLLKWKDAFNPKLSDLGKMTRLQALHIGKFLAYGHDRLVYNPDRQRLLAHFQAIQKLKFTVQLQDPSDMINDQYLVEGMRGLPNVTFLSLVVTANGHSFGACLFTILKMCSGITRLALDMLCLLDEECLSDCFCVQPANWKFEELVLDCLQEVEFSNLRGTAHEVAFVERLFGWAKVLKKMTVTFDEWMSESMSTKEFCQKLLSFSRPEVCVRFYVYRHWEKVLYVPVESD